jgi:hypothetical protein
MTKPVLRNQGNMTEEDLQLLGRSGSTTVLFVLGSWFRDQYTGRCDHYCGERRGGTNDGGRAALSEIVK